MFGGNENIQIIQNRERGQGSREHDLLTELVIFLVTRSSVTVEKVKNIGGGESGVMCVVFNFLCDKLHKPVSQMLRGLY